MKSISQHFCCRLTLLAVFGMSFSALAQDEVEKEQPAITAESLEKTAERIFQAKKAISAESSAWENQRVQFTELIAIREREIADLEESTMGAMERVGDVKAKRGALEKEEADRKAWRADFEKRVAGLEEQMRAAIPVLPKPVVEKIEESVGRLNVADPETPLQERFRDVLAILGAVQDFSKKLTILTEIRAIGDREVEVDVMYLGLNQAWYADRSGKTAGIGRPAAQGWVWEEDKSAGPKIREAISIHRKELPAAMTQLPFSGKAE